MISQQPFHHGKPGITAFHPGLPDADNFPFNAWSKLLARRARQARGDLFGTYHVTGYPPLCEAIARYLSASRGVVCRPEQIIVTNGAQSAFDLLARLLTDPDDAVWIEEPGYYGARAAFESAGARLTSLSGRRPRAGISRLRRRRRVRSSSRPPAIIRSASPCPWSSDSTLIGLAAEWQAWIVEDDYDSEYRFQGQPIPALQGLAPDARVVFVGTFAKILFPAMRLGYMVVPMDLRDSLTAALSVTGQFAPLITQAALADFINQGFLTRHLRRMRRIYAARREFFIDQFDRTLGRWMILHRTDSGIQLAGIFRDAVDDRVIAGAARERGVNVSPLSLQYRHRAPHQGLLMGFAAADDRTTQRSMQVLADLLAEGFAGREEAI